MLAETIEHESGVTARIHYEEDGSGNPREWDQLGVMYCWHPNYELGDEQFTRSDHDTIEEVFTFLVQERKAIETIPLFLPDHSGITIRTGTPIDISHGLTPEAVRATNRFVSDGAGWDTSWVGFIYATEERRDELGAPRKDVVQQLENEVEEYDLYLTGQVFFFVVDDPDGDTFESCGGFLGMDHVTSEVKEVIEACVERVEREKAEREFWLNREVLTVG